MGEPNEPSTDLESWLSTHSERFSVQTDGSKKSEVWKFFGSLFFESDIGLMQKMKGRVVCTECLKAIKEGDGNELAK